MQIKPNKSPLRKGFWPFSFERSATFPPQADHVFMSYRLILICGGPGQQGVGGWTPSGNKLLKWKQM